MSLIEEKKMFLKKNVNFYISLNIQIHHSLSPNTCSHTLYQWKWWIFVWFFQWVMELVNQLFTWLKDLHFTICSIVQRTVRSNVFLIKTNLTVASFTNSFYAFIWIIFFTISMLSNLTKHSLGKTELINMVHKKVQCWFSLIT